MEYLTWAITALIGYVVYLVVEKRRNRKALQVLIDQRKRQQQLNFAWAKKISSQISQEKSTEILELSFNDLREKLQKRELRPLEVLRAYIGKALECTEKTNCVCQFIEESLITAQDLEKKLEDPNFVAPPLFGIPVSIKESIHVRHMDSTMGFAQNLYQPSSKNANCVQQLVDLGAVPFVHTNVPQALLSFGCVNPIYGTTKNPLDSSRVPGGSSGGEAALIAEGGSILGIGTDVGGSIRTPASFCGIAGFKPSSERLSQLGKVASIPGRQLLVTVEGPMAKNLDTCIDYFQTSWSQREICSLRERDPFVPPVGWQNNLFKSDKKLTIGYYTFDGYTIAPPAYQRAVLDTVQVLRDLGHDLVEFQVPTSKMAFELFVAGVTGDGGVYLNRAMNSDIVPPECSLGFQITLLPTFLQRLIIKFMPDSRLKGIVEALPKDCDEMREMFEKIEDYRHDFVRALRRQNIDAIVCPAFGTIPPYHGVPRHILPATSYTALFNLIDFPAGTVPVTRVTAKDEAEVDNMPEDDTWEVKIKEQCKGSLGLPISVQIATPPYREETCLRLLKNVESAIGLHK